MSTTIPAIARLVDTLGSVPFVVAALTKGSLLVLVAVGLTRLLGRAPAAARHLVWSLSIAALLLLPATPVMPWRLELSALGAARDAFGVTTTNAPPSRGAARPESAPNAGRGVPSSVATLDTAESRPMPSPAAVLSAGSVPRSGVWARFEDPATLLISVWLAGVLWMVGRLAVGVINVRRMVRQASRADASDWSALVDHARHTLGVHGAARIVISDTAAMPFTYGLVRPTIVLPASAEAWSHDRRRSVLLHELAHVRRRDLLTNAVVQVAYAIYWFHPLVRFASRRVRIEAERACDALVVAAGTRPSDYAGDLLEIARTMRSSATAAVALAMARRSDFEGRLLAILAPDSGRNVLTAARAALIALSFAMPAVAIAAAVPASRSTPNEAMIPRAAARERLAPTANTAVETPTAPDAAPAALQSSGQDSQAATRTQGRDTAVPALISVLKDESAAVRLAAVESLGNLTDPRAIDALVQALRTDTDARVREAAAEALGQIDNARAVPGLIAALGSERVSAVRAKIAWALGEIADARAVDALGVAVRDSAVEVRRQAVESLGEIESPAAAPLLIPVLRDSDVETRMRAAEALGQAKSTDAVPALSAAAKDPDAEVRKRVVESLGQLQDKRALPALSVAAGDAEAEVRRQAVEAIGQLEDLKSAPPALINALRDEDHDVRKAAAEAIGQLEDEAAVPALIPLTRDANTDVKHAAVEALASIGGARAVEVMAALLKDDDPEIRKLAAQALGKNR